MTSSEAAELIGRLHGAFPNVFVDDAVAEMFANSFITNDYGYSKQAIHEWVQTMERFPTIAEINRIIRRLKNDEAERTALPAGPIGKPDLSAAKAAFASGYRRARGQAGDTEEEIERKLEAHMTRGIGVELPDA